VNKVMFAKKILFALLLGGFVVIHMFSQPVLWSDYVILRDTMYNRQVSANEMQPFYSSAIESAKKTFSGSELLTALSKCEYIMGRAYLYEAQNAQAGEYFDKGAQYAKQAADASNLSDAWLMYAENISQNCSVKPTSYAITNGSKISGLASRVLKMDPANGAALYLSNAQHVYAPAPFNNYKKGIKNLSEILADSSVRMQKDDEFNIISSIGYAYYQLKNYGEAAAWFTRALEIYPGNEFVAGMLKKAQSGK
jgi:tetratricopeptide (TPR) repeat protein